MEYGTHRPNTDPYFALSWTVTVNTFVVVDSELEWITVTLSVVRHWDIPRVHGRGGCCTQRRRRQRTLDFCCWHHLGIVCVHGGLLDQKKHTEQVDSLTYSTTKTAGKCKIEFLNASHSDNCSTIALQHFFFFFFVPVTVIINLTANYYSTAVP